VLFSQQAILTALPGPSTNRFPDLRAHPEQVLEASLR
jgi:hypothetical protein